MATAIWLIAMIASLGAFVCFVVMLIRQFQIAGPVQGLVGIVTCGLWTFIWSWKNATRLESRNLLLTWIALFLISILIWFLGGTLMAAAGET